MVCSSCGAELPPRARFCAYCGTPAPQDAGAGIAEERRVVTILFVDLVGFTERSDRADPEDVRRTLVPFHRRVKEDLERFGGTLDKFIGDAVMGVFGAPVAHEDDALRAVRAGMRILDSIEELRRADPAIAVRIAVNSGEAVVSFGSGPQVGEAVAGDVVNTASRMQSLAPRDSVVVGETTLEAIRAWFDVEELLPATVKGKREPLRVWRVVAEREETEPERTPFVGRDAELAAVAEAFSAMTSAGTCRTLTIVGDAGVGKSRLVAESEQRLMASATVVRGTIRPYGEDVAFGAVADTVRALAGIGTADDPDTALAKLDALTWVAASGASDRRWLGSTLAAVMGLETTDRERAIPVDEIADAWASVLVGAVEGPLVLVLEDLDRAEEGLMRALEAAVDALADRPVLVLSTARPELFEEHPTWGVERPGRGVLRLGTLDGAATRDLLGAVLPGETLPPATRDAVLERSGGNPLYAIEFARMLADTGGARGRLDTPVSVQAVISARLDAIPAQARAVVLDAAVLGDEVWPEALAAIGRRSVRDVRAALEHVERRGLLARRRSSLPGIDAYGFAHGLMREVAYSRLPRRERADRHLRAATWLEEMAGDRADEWAESLARHLASACDLADAAGEHEVAERSRTPALRWLTAAGDRAARVDPSAAFTAFERGLALAQSGRAERGGLLWRAAAAGRQSGMLDAQDVLTLQQEGLALARASGDEEDVGAWLTRIGSQLSALGETERARAALAEAVQTLERLPPGRPLARAYAYRAEEELFGGDTEEAMALADRALELISERPDELAVMALHLRGDARCSMGDLEHGLADLREALRRAEESGVVGDIVTSRNYLAEWRWAVEGPASGLTEWETALDLAERRHVVSQAAYARAGALGALHDLGEWDRVLAWTDQLLRLPPQRLDPVISVVAAVGRTLVLLPRGQRTDVPDPAELLGRAERIGELHAVAPALVATAAVALEDGDIALAAERLEAFFTVTRDVAPEYRAADLARAVRLALGAGAVDLAERLVEAARPRVPRDRLRLDAARAMLADAEGEGDAQTFADLARRLHGWDAFEEAMASLAHTRLTGDRASQARAEEIFGRLGVPATWA